MKFKVDKKVFEKIPNLYIGVVVAYNVDNEKEYSDIKKLLDDVQQSYKEKFENITLREQKNIAAYRNVFTELKINPNKYMSSIEAMSKRVLSGKLLPSINPIVDLVNYISLNNIVPMGAHDIDQLVGNIHIRFSNDLDEFTPLGSNKKEILKDGELVYSDDEVIRTRRWIWRQSSRGKIDKTSKNIFFPIDGFIGENEDSINNAMNDIESLLKDIFNCETKVGIVSKDNPEIFI
ncbi:MAG: phenylalanine--tRNA ligase beta subunit-related protein [Bacillota bacterium]|nr:phenylalanine--tRNA ligase beta subunit-related protein [Bacillota bacterium]